MREIGLRYVHFLLALGAGVVAALVGAFPAAVTMGMPGTNWVNMGMLWFGLVPAAVLGSLAFWAVGRRGPLGASLGRTALAATGAACAAAALLRAAAQVAWLTGDGALLLVLVGLATLGFLPFAWGPPSRPSSREGLAWREQT